MRKWFNLILALTKVAITYLLLLAIVLIPIGMFVFALYCAFILIFTYVPKMVILGTAIALLIIGCVVMSQ